jgi:hypothetical protein
MSDAGWLVKFREASAPSRCPQCGEGSRLLPRGGEKGAASEAFECPRCVDTKGRPWRGRKAQACSKCAGAMIQLQSAHYYECEGCRSRWRVRGGEADLRPQERSVRSALMHFADWQTGGGITVGIPRLAVICGLSSRNVEKAISRLARAGVIEIDEREGGRGRPREIRIVLPRLELIETPSPRDGVSPPQTPSQAGAKPRPGSAETPSWKCGNPVLEVRKPRPPRTGEQY